MTQHLPVDPATAPEPTAPEAVAWPHGLVAFWDFGEPAPPFAARGRGDFPLADGPGSAVRSVEGGPFGRAVRFDGIRDHLRVPHESVGALDLAAAGACTVVAWIRRAVPTALHFVAGLWQEDDDKPGRQYGLFVSLPLYGGEDQVCGHVSRTGGATPGYPYSRDYSATARTVPPGEWHCVAFSYDGERITSHLDGETDDRPAYTDPTGASYAKNPYRFTDGLNPRPVGDFTVGAVRLTTGMGNHFEGEIGGVAVFDRALSAAELRDLHEQVPLP